MNKQLGKSEALFHHGFWSESLDRQVQCLSLCSLQKKTLVEICQQNLNSSCHSSGFSISSWFLEARNYHADGIVWGRLNVFSF